MNIDDLKNGRKMTTDNPDSRVGFNEVEKYPPLIKDLKTTYF